VPLHLQAASPAVVAVPRGLSFTMKLERDS
jgi:hypothetical protein